MPNLCLLLRQRWCYMESQVREQLPDEVRATLAHYGEPSPTRDMAIDPWEFALPLLHLVEQGAGQSELRWLVVNGYIDHADEVTTFRDPVRKFRRRANVAFTAKTCFVFAEAGAFVMDAMRRGCAAWQFRELWGNCLVSFYMPHWDSKRRVSISATGWSSSTVFMRPIRRRSLPRSRKRTGHSRSRTRFRRHRVCHPSSVYTKRSSRST